MLKKIVTSLEVSKKLDIALKKAGIKVEPLFWWSKDFEGNTYSLESYRGKWAEDMVQEDTYYSALTASEIGEILPEMIITNEMNGEFGLTIFKRSIEENKYCWEVSYEREDKLLVLIIEDTLQDTMAEMLCYLLDNGLLTY